MSPNDINLRYSVSLASNGEAADKWLRRFNVRHVAYFPRISLLVFRYFSPSNYDAREVVESTGQKGERERERGKGRLYGGGGGERGEGRQMTGPGKNVPISLARGSGGTKPRAAVAVIIDRSRGIVTLGPSVRCARDSYKCGGKRGRQGGTAIGRPVTSIVLDARSRSSNGCRDATREARVVTGFRGPPRGAKQLGYRVETIVYARARVCIE